MKRLLIALAIMAVPAAALAQTGSSGAPAAAPVGGIDQAQFRAHRAQAVMRMDADHDGRISPAEFSAFMASRKHGGGKGGDGAKAFARLDANHDGFLSSDELAVLADRHFEKLDTNHDGKLDASERQAAHHGHGDRQASPTGL